MKKAFAIILILAIVFSFISCKNASPFDAIALKLEDTTYCSDCLINFSMSGDMI